MTHSFHLVWIALIILLILGYLHLYYKKDKFKPKVLQEEDDPEDFLSIEDVYIFKNKEDYELYLQHKRDTIKNNSFEFGYSKNNNTDPQTLGFCPLGFFFDGDFTGNSKDIYDKCKPCFQCNKVPGYYFKGGCVGNTDSICEYGKIPYNIFINSHSGGNLLHSQISKGHTHPLTNGKISNVNHSHI